MAGFITAPDGETVASLQHVRLRAGNAHHGSPTPGRCDGTAFPVLGNDAGYGVFWSSPQWDGVTCMAS